MQAGYSCAHSGLLYTAQMLIPSCFLYSRLPVTFPSSFLAAKEGKPWHAVSGREGERREVLLPGWSMRSLGVDGREGEMGLECSLCQKQCSKLFWQQYL